MAGIDEVVDRFDFFQRRHRVIAFPYAVLKRYGEDRGGWLGAVTSYYALFALLPLLLVLVSLVTWLFHDHPTVRDEILDAVWSQLPFVGPDVTLRVKPVTGNPAVVLFAMLVSLWGATSVVKVAQDLTNAIWGVPRFEQPGFMPKLARTGAVFLLLLVGVFGSAAVAGITLGRDFLWVHRVGIGVLSATVNVALAIALLRFLNARRLRVRQILPGACILGFGVYLLSLVGGLYLGRVVARASSLYGSFAGMIGLLAWIALLVQLLVIATLVDSVRDHHLWPRSFTGRNLEAADERAVDLTMERERLLARERSERLRGDAAKERPPLGPRA